VIPRKPCQHKLLRCLNQYELIRKYECARCHGVIVCQCDEVRGNRFLPHQLKYGSRLDTQERVAVTDGFHPKICNECRGEPPEPCPKSARRGSTSKIKRYYWREIAFRRMELFAAMTGGGDVASMPQDGLKSFRNAASAQALEEVKRQHEVSPKYAYLEVSQEKVLRDCKVEVLNLEGLYSASLPGERARIVSGQGEVSAESYASSYFQDEGYETLKLESRPFHVLFGVYMWLLIQDPTDDHVRISGFGDRHAFDRGEKGQIVWTAKPSDFGTPGYGKRRASAIAAHLSPQQFTDENMQWLFDYWLEPSENLRQYLWAHRTADVDTARELITILPANVVVRMLEYLVNDYWGRFLGWPDLGVHRPGEWFLAEVKSSSDKLSEQQKTWIQGNHGLLRLPYKLVKIHRKSDKQRTVRRRDIRTESAP
jgi:hypothetical protein